MKTKNLIELIAVVIALFLAGLKYISPWVAAIIIYSVWMADKYFSPKPKPKEEKQSKPDAQRLA